MDTMYPERGGYQYDEHDNATTIYTMPVHDAIRQSLEQANMIRIALAIGEGKLDALPKGKPGDPAQCVIAKALSNGWEACVDNDQIELSHDGEETVDLIAAAEALTSLGFEEVKGFGGSISFNTTTAMHEVISLFDDGKLPDLILESE